MDEQKALDTSVYVTPDGQDSKDAVLIQPAATDFSQQLSEHGLILGVDGYVRWEHRNPSHPRNWKTSRKVYDTGVILFLEFIT